jgi:hypothetical protein
MLAAPAAGASCAGTATGTAPLPSFTVRPVAATALRVAAAHGVRARVVTNPSVSYAYDLAANWPDKVPDGATVSGRGAAVAALVESYRTVGASSADGLGLYENLTGWLPGLSSAVFGLSRRVPFPSTVTHYVTASARWDKEVVVADDATGGAYAQFESPGRTYAGGSTTADTWFGAPVGAFSSRLMSDAYGWQVEPNRQGDDLYVMVSTLVDTAGHLGSILYFDEFAAKFYRNGKLLVDAWDPLMLNGFPVPAGRASYRLDVVDTRQNAFWQRSTTVHDVWSFSSSTPSGDHAILPLLNVQYDMALSADATARAGAPLPFSVLLSMPEGRASTRILHPKVQLSWDGGTTWSGNLVRSCAPTGTDSAGGHPTRCSVVAPNARPGHATLRVTGSDSAGNGVVQTIVDAYVVR